MNEHLVNAKKGWQIANSADAKRAAYIYVAEELISAMKEDRKLTQAALASATGISHQTVAKLLKWKKSGFKADTPFLQDEQATSRAARSHTKKVLRDPVERRQVMEALSDNERAEIIEDASAKSGPKVRKAVESADEREAKERFKKNRDAVDQRRKPTPLSAFYNSMSSKMAQWSQDLRAVRSVGLDTLAPNQVPRMIEAHEDLVKEAQKNIRILKGEDTPKDDDVIEGTATVVPIRKEIA